MLKLDGSASELHWNPKEDKLAVALAPTAGIDDHIMFRKVHIVDLKTNKTTNLNNPGKLGQVAWSPGGKKLVIITGAHKHDPKEGRLKITAEFAKGASKGWTELGFQGHVESIAWGKGLSVLGSYGVNSYYRVLRPEYEPQTESWAPDESQRRGSPGLILSTVSCSSLDAKIGACVAHTASHPPEVYYWDGDLFETSGKPRRLTDSNPWVKNMKLAKQEVIKYKARDGLELEGILIHPLSRKAGERVPLVVNVHGGPEAHYSNGWVTLYHSLGQVAAAKGMAVFYPNYRGSTGYGVEFSMKGQKEAGGKEFDDIVDGVDHLVKMGLVDEKKVGITGGSYGGYATAWGATYYSHRFAAGVMFVGISDWISCSGTTDIPQEMFLVHHRKWLWDDWDYFAKASPLKYLDKAKTPLLIMHGKNDPRVNPGQSLELYRHLKVRNQAPVRLVLYPGEGHGNRRAASRLDYNLRMLQWMEHYLQGPGGNPPPQELDYGLTPPTKTSGMSWRQSPAHLDAERPSSDTISHYWPGRGCPCCIGW